MFVVMHVSSLDPGAFTCDANMEILTFRSIDTIITDDKYSLFMGVKGLKEITNFASENYKAENNALYSIKDNALLLYASKDPRKKVTFDCFIIKTYAVCS